MCLIGDLHLSEVVSTDLFVIFTNVLNFNVFAKFDYF